MKPHVLVTGGAGYIGSHTCKALAQAGYVPVTCDHLEQGHQNDVRWGPLIQTDIRHKTNIIRILQDYSIQAVLHFAASTYVGESMTQPDLYYENNIGGSLTLLQAMLETNVKKIVFSSSCAIYGTPLQLPLTEDHPQNPINPYGFTKLVVERMLKDFSKAYGLQSICLRYFNAAGSDPELELMEDHDPETHLIPLAIRAAFDPNQPLTILGTDYATSDGTCIRDYVHVTDLAQAHLQALSQLVSIPISENLYEVYNLGCGRGYSVREVITAVEQMTKRKLPFQIGPRRLGDPPQLIASCEKAMLKLEWKPRYSTLHCIIKTAIDSQLNRNLFDLKRSIDIKLNI